MQTLDIFKLQFPQWQINILWTAGTYAGKAAQ